MLVIYLNQKYTNVIYKVHVMTMTHAFDQILKDDFRHKMKFDNLRTVRKRLLSAKVLFLLLVQCWRHHSLTAECFQLLKWLNCLV